MIIKIDDVEIPDEIVIVKSSCLYVGEKFFFQPLKIRISPYKYGGKEVLYFTYKLDDNSLASYFLYAHEMKEITWITWEQFNKIKAFL